MKVGKLIAAGGFKQVFEGIYCGNPVAVSVLNGTASSIQKSERKTKLLARELRAMNMLSNHPNVPKFYGHCSMTVTNEEEQIVLVNELCELGDMTSFVDTQVFLRMEMRNRMVLCVDILRVLTMMHDQGIFHRRLFKEVSLTFR